jgi:hypothetical protein
MSRLRSSAGFRWRGRSRCSSSRIGLPLRRPRPPVSRPVRFAAIGRVSSNIGIAYGLKDVPGSPPPPGEIRASTRVSDTCACRFRLLRSGSNWSRSFEQSGVRASGPWSRPASRVPSFSVSRKRPVSAGHGWTGYSLAASHPPFSVSTFSAPSSGPGLELDASGSWTSRLGSRGSASRHAHGPADERAGGAGSQRAQEQDDAGEQAHEARTGPRSSAPVYLYAGLRAGAMADDVLSRAEADDAPFARSEELRAWVAQGLDELS